MGISSSKPKHKRTPTIQSKARQKQSTPVQMEGNMKSGVRAIKGKVATAYSKYAGVKAQTKSAPTVTAHVYQPRYPASSIDATATRTYGGGDVDERATAFILSVRERFKNEQNMMS
uniref:Uncharacterized protein n=1 Tax=Avena sativa TaxID=4498 RepID=A0ACD5WLQ0_AVESA